ncbi:ligase-associated DNA damage response endonuclease PdeM [Paracoccus sp. p4-l81]|uniref:ligase-associated DNA damage response endonuclease PdeM n=1 Tax=unclassified Paracoccus (in: a-proteobacteria) TaxID=2688777 RepID=UPI0035B9BFA4
MTGYAFDFAGARLIARPSGGLWWPGQGALVLADLHLGKAGRMARRGGALLPPFDNRDTLARLMAEVAALSPRQVILLGDSFDDDQARGELSAEDGAVLAGLASRCDLVWIGGNHDPGDDPAQITLAGITLRHQAGAGPDMSGHFHPKVTVAGRRRAAFLIGRDHLILPAFGSYTGGMDADTGLLRDLVGPGRAVLLGGSRAVPVPFG